MTKIELFESILYW